VALEGTSDPWDSLMRISSPGGTTQSEIFWMVCVAPPGLDIFSKLSQGSLVPSGAALALGLRVPALRAYCYGTNNISQLLRTVYVGDVFGESKLTI
jgi:hypothetical protein